MKQKEKNCDYCGEEFIPERRHAMYCSSTCRQYSYIKRKTGETPYDRVKQKIEINHQLQSVPALVIDGLEENPVEQNQELSIASIDNRQSASTKNESEINLASKETINTPSIDDYSSKKSYNDLLNQEKEMLNELLLDWWYSNESNRKVKSKMFLANRETKKFLQQLLSFDGMQLRQEQMKRFLFELKAWNRNPISSGGDFIPVDFILGDMEEIANSFIKKLEAIRLPLLQFVLPVRTKAQFEIMAKFMNQFNPNTPSFWVIP